MGLSQDEKNKLQVFSNIPLNRIQTETIIGRKLTDAEWESRNHDYPKICSPIAKQAVKAAIQNKGVKEHKKFEGSKQLKYFSTFWKSIDRSQDSENAKSIRATRYSKLYKSVAQEAADVGYRKQFKTNIEDEKNKFHFVKSLFKHTSDSFKINKINEYYNAKFKASISDWKIYGSINLFNIHRAIAELIRRMTSHLPQNSKIQVRLKIANSTRQPYTGLLSKPKAIDMLSEWVNFFIDYHDMDIENITFKLTAIEIPQGAGRKVNAIINLDDKRCITQIKNNDTICLVRAIIVALSYNKDKLQEVFKGKLTDQEIAAINFRRQKKTQIHEGKISDNEIKYLRDGGEKKLQTVLAQAFHRIYSIPIRKRKGNDFEDVKLIEEKLDIEIQIYDMGSRKLYAGKDRSVKLYLVLSNEAFQCYFKTASIYWVKCENLGSK